MSKLRTLSLLPLLVVLCLTGCEKAQRSTSSASSSPSEPAPGSPQAAAPPPTSPGRGHKVAARPALTPPPTDEELLSTAMAKLRPGNLAYNTPQTMKVGETAHVTARIGSDQVSVASLEAGMPGEPGAKTQLATMPISTRMKMSLKGADFEITALSSEEQFVGGDSPTTWEWDVVPKHSGQLRLHLAATVELKDLSRDFTSVDRDVAVKVDPINAAQEFVQKNWQWLIATITAIVGAAWKYYSGRKKPNDTSVKAS